VWKKADTGVWTLQEDRYFAIYEGQTDETKRQWFLVEYARNDRMMFFIDQKPVMPHFLGRASGIAEGLDLADAEIARRRFERAAAKENA